MPKHLNSRNIFFIRHGQSESNVNEHMAAGSHKDAALTELGKKQAEALGERFKREGIYFDYLFTSKLSRAIDTAQIFLSKLGNKEIPTKRSEKLDELQIPGWRGKARSDVVTTEIQAMWGKSGKHYSPADGESEYELQKRYMDFIDEEIIFNNEIEKIPESINIAVVVHGWALRCFFQHILEYDQSFIKKMSMDNTSISQFKYSEIGWRLVRINDSSHLEKFDENSRRYS